MESKLCRKIENLRIIERRTWSGRKLPEYWFDPDFIKNHTPNNENHCEFRMCGNFKISPDLRFCGRHATIPDLKDLCRLNGLTTHGTKFALIQRLEKCRY